MDLTPIGPMSNIHKMASIGEKGVTLLMNESTNAEREGVSLSESKVDATLSDLFSKQRGRIIIATFASNIDRVQQIINAAYKYKRKVVVMGRACRNAANIKNRQPIGTMYVKAPHEVGEYYVEIMEDELYVKKVLFTDDVRDFTSYTFKPQLRTVGPKYGKQLGGIQKHLASVDGNAAMDELKAQGAIKFMVGDVEISLAEEDLLIDMSQKEGFVSEADYGITVVLDTNLTEELLEEGFVYEVISKIQTMRKDSDFEVMDHIKVYISGNDKIAGIVQKNEQAIGEKVLADEFIYAEGGIAKEWNVNGENVTIGVEKK